ALPIYDAALEVPGQADHDGVEADGNGGGEGVALDRHAVDDRNGARLEHQRRQLLRKKDVAHAAPQRAEDPLLFEDEVALDGLGFELQGRGLVAAEGVAQVGEERTPQGAVGLFVQARLVLWHVCSVWLLLPGLRQLGVFAVWAQL